MCQPEAQSFSEHALLGCFLVDMERLRVVFPGKGLDRLRPRKVGAELDGSPKRKNASRVILLPRARGTCRCSATGTFSPRWLSERAADRHEAQARDAIRRARADHGAAAGQRVAGDHRLLPFGVVDAGEPCDVESSRKPSQSMRMNMQQVCQPDRAARRADWPCRLPRRDASAAHRIPANSMIPRSYGLRAER